MAQVNVNINAAGSSDGPFDAGQKMAGAIFEQIHQQAGRESATRIMVGVFSGSMAALQALLGTEAVRAIFERFAAEDDGAAPVTGVH